MLPRRFTHHKCSRNIAAVTFLDYALRVNGSSGFLFFFYISNVKNPYWKCVLGAWLTVEMLSRKTAAAYTVCSVCYYPSTPNSCIWFAARCWTPRSLSVACSPNEKGISGYTGSLIALLNSIMYEILDCVSTSLKTIHRELLAGGLVKSIFALSFFLVSLPVSLGSSCLHHIIVKHIKAHSLTGIPACTYYMLRLRACKWCFALWEKMCNNSSSSTGCSWTWCPEQVKGLVTLGLYPAGSGSSWPSNSPPSFQEDAGVENRWMEHTSFWNCTQKQGHLWKISICLVFPPPIHLLCLLTPVIRAVGVCWILSYRETTWRSWQIIAGPNRVTKESTPIHARTYGTLRVSNSQDMHVF